MKIIEKRENGTVRVKTVPEGESLTQQQFADETNINKIMKKYHATGMITHLNRKQGQYVDLSNVKNYQESLQTVIDAQKSFMTLPSEVRKRFENDPQQIINFLSDENNREEAISLGLIQKKVEANDEIKNDLNDIKTTLASLKK